MDTESAGERLEEGVVSRLGDIGNTCGCLGCGVVGIFVAWDRSVSSDHSGGFGGECGGSSDCGSGNCFGGGIFNDGAFHFRGGDRDESFKCPVGSFAGGGVGVDGDLAGRPFCRGGSESVVRAWAGIGDCGGGGICAHLGDRGRR